MTELLISVGMLVCVLAYVVMSYHRVMQLHRAVQLSWEQWVAATRRRNACLSDFADVFERLSPPTEPQPRTLRQLLADSSLSLKLSPQPIWGVGLNYLPRAEEELLRQLSSTLHDAEEKPNEHMQQICGFLRSSLDRQDQCARSFNQSAVAYNRVLAEPPQRLLAPLFGFAAAATLQHRRGDAQSE